MAPPRIPREGTPERDLWLAAIAVALEPPLRQGQASAARVSWHLVRQLRDALEGAGVDWEAAKLRQDAGRRAPRPRDGER